MIYTGFWTTPSTPTEPSCGIPRALIFVTSLLVPGYVTPSRLNLNKINKFIKKAREKTITNIPPLSSRNVSWVSSKSVSASDPTVINIILDIVDPVYGPP
jgi:hypothetical protein